MRIISGTTISQMLRDELRQEVAQLKANRVHPCLAVIIVGEDPASQAYVGRKIKMCATLGIESIEKRLPADTDESVLSDVIESLNRDESVHGILCQLPLPPAIDESRVLRAIDKDKDVDCFHPHNVGLLMSGEAHFVPCTPMGIMYLLERAGINPRGKRAVVLGRSKIVGRPLSILLSSRGADATVTLCHSATQDLKVECRRADILIAALGKPLFVTEEYVKSGAILIDVGINRVEADNERGFRLVGDIDRERVSTIAGAITPVPGGVGPMTIIMLMKNTITAARAHVAFSK